MTEDIFERLAQPFPVERVSWRVGATNKKFWKEGAERKGRALAYIDARDVMERLDDVCGPAGWQCRYPHANGKTVCEIGVRLDHEWIWKADGAGDTDMEAEKGALSDAFKRAAVRWGVGRYLYEIPSPNLVLDDRWQIPKDEYKKLEDLLSRYSQEWEWGTPESRATLRVLAQTIQNTVHTTDDVRLWREANAGSFPQMRVKAREHIETLLSRIEDESNAKAA